MNFMTTKALVLQGGGALGAYQIGVYQALQERDYLPDMVVGISIGAINAAIIVGNKPEDRLAKLNYFWNKITHDTLFTHADVAEHSKFHNLLSANLSMNIGQEGFFSPKFLNPWLFNDLDPTEYSYYDTSPLKETLLEVIDFKYLNSTPVRLSLGAVNLESGEFVFFDNQEIEIIPEHIMASGALPPGFPPVKIGDHYYIDGGVFYNTPLVRVIDLFSGENAFCVNNILCFMVDLFSVSGRRPRSMDGILERVKDIQFSSRTKRFISLYSKIQELTYAFNMLAPTLTEEQKQIPCIAERMENLGCPHHMDIVQIIYHSERGTELHSKDYEFSRASYLRHMEQGYKKAMDMIDKYSSSSGKNSKRSVELYSE